MFDIAQSLNGPMNAASLRLEGAASETSRAATPFGNGRGDGSMAATAQNAIFTEALLNAIHARLAEIKVASHG